MLLVVIIVAVLLPLCVAFNRIRSSRSDPNAGRRQGRGTVVSIFSHTRLSPPDPVMTLHAPQSLPRPVGQDSLNRGMVLIVDVETTGIDQSRDEVIELAAVLLDYDCAHENIFRVCDRYCGLRQPTIPIGSRAL
jgi:hypothetical protein